MVEVIAKQETAIQNGQNISLPIEIKNNSDKTVNFISLKISEEQGAQTRDLDN